MPANRIVVLDEGKIVETGGTTTLREAGSRFRTLLARPIFFTRRAERLVHV
jgi:ABC-type multidrug transport system fused ATPase/permease subunit